MLRSLALVLSRLFDPILVIPTIIVMVVGLAMANGYEWWFLAVLLGIDAGIPGAYVVRRYHRNGRQDWDFRNPRDRSAIYLLTIGAHFLGLLFVDAYGTPELTQLLLLLWLVAVGFAFITWYWKISVHAGVNTTLALMVIYFFGWQAVWIWFVPIGVSWSRVYLGYHTTGQVLAGMIVPTIIIGGTLTVY